MANTFTLSKSRILGGVDGKSFVVLTGLLTVDASGKDDGDLPASLFGLQEVIGALPMFDDSGSIILPVANADGTSLILGGFDTTDNVAVDKTITGLVATIIGVQ